MNDWWEQVRTMFVEPARGWPVCEAGHVEHRRDAAWVNLTGATGDVACQIAMTVFAADEYRGTPGYCPGDDDVSRTLVSTGSWEPVESQMFRDTLQRTPGVVLDIGAHVGWYSLIAQQMRREVFAFEAVSEHIALLRNNVPGVHVVQAWIGEDVPHLPYGAPDIAIAKIDIEGNEQYALEMLWPLIRAGEVANILMEVSPTFNDGYPRLIRLLMNEGYTAEVCNPFLEFDDSEIGAVCAQFPQVEMMFRRQT